MFIAALLAFAPAAFAQDETYGVDGYQALEAQLEELDLARVATEPGSDARIEATIAAIAHRRALIQYISGWLRAGTVPERAEAGARAARLILVENIVHLSVELGRCDEAGDSLTIIEGFGRSDDPETQASYDAAVSAVEECVSSSEEPVVAEPERLAEEPPVPDSVEPEIEPVPVESPAEPPVVRRRGNPTAAALIGVGVAATVGGAAWNLALLGDVNDYRDARDACEGGELSDCDDARSLRSDLASAKAPIAALVGGGLALTAVGALLHLTDRDARAGHSLAIVPSRDSLLVQLRISAGGGR